MNRPIDPPTERPIDDEGERRNATKLTGTAPEEGPEGPELADIIDASALQSLMDDFYQLTRIPVSIIDLKGRVLVGVGWQKVCINYHRAHPEACKHCVESDTLLTAGIPPGEFRLYKCKNNMWDVATPIMTGGRHVGNILSGQFFFEDEPMDEGLFRAQARKYGFDEEAYIAALQAAPRLRREDLNTGMTFFQKLTDLLSRLSYNNRQLAQSLAERDALTASLRESESRLKRAQEIAHLGSWELDLVDDTLTWSDEVYRIFGLEPQEFGATYEAFLEAVHPDDRAAVDAAYSGSLREGRDVYEIEHRIVKRQTGEVRIVHEKCEHIRNGSGRIVRSIGMVHDITRRKQAEEALRESQDQLQTILESAPAGLLVAAADGSFIFKNRLAEEMVGGQVTGTAYGSKGKYTIHHPDGSPFPAGDLPLPCALRGESAHEKELLIRYQNGEERTVLASAKPILTASGRISGAVAAMLDITERKRLEQELSDSERLLRNVMDTLPVGVWIVDKSGQITSGNPAGQKIWAGLCHVGIENYGEYKAWWFHTGKRIQPEEWAAARAVSKGEISIDEVIEIEAFDGTRKIVLNSAMPIRDERGEIIGAIIVNQDITARKRSEEELLKLQKLESISLLAGGIAHDFNNILTAILGNITLAKMFLPPGEKAVEKLNVAEQASLRARGLSNQLLTFARGGAPIKKTTSVPGLIMEAVDFILRGSPVKAESTFPPDLWPVEADESQMNQAISNLAINAVQAMPEGGKLTLAAANVSLPPENGLGLPAGRYIRIDMKDQGSGIPKEEQEKIFDPYYTTKEMGSGLGLSIAFSVVKRHGGTITVDSRPGEGSTFSIFLPASKCTMIGSKSEEDETRGSVAGSGRILVMDDEETIREVAAEMLHHLGYRVETARDGAEAVTAYQQALVAGKPFDAVITDLTVPAGMGGKETVRRLLEIDTKARVIVASGYGNDPIMSEYAAYGFKGIIPKPFRLTDLGKTLQEVIGGS